MDFARQHRRERGEVERRVRNVAQLIAERIVRLRDRVQSGDLVRAHQVHGAQIIEGGRYQRLHALLRFGERGRRRADADDQRRGEGFGGRAQGNDKMPHVRFEARAFRPIFESHQHDIDAVAVHRQCAGGVQQQLEHLVVGRQFDTVIEAQLAHPEGQRGLDGIRREGGADDYGRASHRGHHYYRGRRADASPLTDFRMAL